MTSSVPNPRISLRSSSATLSRSLRAWRSGSSFASVATTRRPRRLHFKPTRRQADARFIPYEWHADTHRGPRWVAPEAEASEDPGAWLSRLREIIVSARRGVGSQDRPGRRRWAPCASRDQPARRHPPRTGSAGSSWHRRNSTECEDRPRSARFDWRLRCTQDPLSIDEAVEALSESNVVVMGGQSLGTPRIPSPSGGRLPCVRIVRSSPRT